MTIEPTPAIQVRGLGIKYRRQLRPNLTLKESVIRLFRIKRFEEFWALREVDFDLQRGERLGVIGRNGAGKTTLLRTLAGFLPPAEGSVETTGRIAALSVGAGMNPELTGRENAILNGIIMGATRAEMIRRLPSIEAFAELGEFFDAPVAAYSRGMRSRLAYAVIDDVDCDILLLDEAFAGGDEIFRERALTRAHQRIENKTLVFVSHALPMVLDLCNRVIWLEKGRIVDRGEPERVIKAYRNWAKQRREQRREEAGLERPSPKEGPGRVAAPKEAAGTDTGEPGRLNLAKK